MSWSTLRHIMGQGILACLLGLMLRGDAVAQKEAAAAGADRPDLLLSAQVSQVEVYAGQTRILQAPWRLRRVSVGNPKVADVQVLEPDKVLLVGKSAGRTDLTAWGEAGQSWRGQLVADVDLAQIQRDLDRLFTGANLRLSYAQQGAADGAAGDKATGGEDQESRRKMKPAYVVEGTLQRAEQVDQLHRLLDAAGLEGRYVDMTRVSGVHQVQIKVRVAEVSRTSIQALGVNALATGSDFFGGSLIGPSGGGVINPINIGPAKGASAAGNTAFRFTQDVTVSPMVTLLAGFPNSDLEFFIQALAENQYLRILAEPNLIALSGEEANFLAGGEFPIPVVQGSTNGGISITIEYKEFGVRLKFQPTVLGESTIRMRVMPEVSNLSDQGAVEIEGFRVPSLMTRRTDTTLEMKSGQTFAIAGLINEDARARSSRVPLLGDVPVLGALFRSVRYERSDTELVVLVKAGLVEPMSLGTEPPLPGESDPSPSDWELYALGKIEGKRPAPLSPDEAAWLKSRGLDKLAGPGAWAAHDQAVERSHATIQAPDPDQTGL